MSTRETSEVLELEDTKSAEHALQPNTSQDKAADKKATDKISICLSGGGIRSASFQVGVLTQLAEEEMFQRIEEISSVSGGGYANASLCSFYRDVCQTYDNERKNNNLSNNECVKRALVMVKKQFTENSNYLLTYTTPLLFILSLTHNLVFWFSLCVLIANFLFYGITFKMQSSDGNIQNYYNHIPLVSNSTVSISGETDLFQTSVLQFFGLATIPNDILQKSYTSYGLHGLPTPVLIVFYIIILLVFLGLLCLAIFYTLKDNWGVNSITTTKKKQIKELVDSEKEKKKRKERKSETSQNLLDSKAKKEENISFWKELLFNIPIFILSFCLAVFLIFVFLFIFFELLKIALFVEGLILLAWSHSSFTISHHIFNAIYITLWLVVGLVSSIVLFAGVTVLKTGTKIALATSGLFLLIVAPLMLLLILSHFCLWQIFGTDGQFSIIPFMDNTEKELYILKVFASVWLCLELYTSGLLNYTFKLLYSIGLTRFLSTNHWLHDSKDDIKFTFNTCVNNLRSTSIAHYSFSSDGSGKSATKHSGLQKFTKQSTAFNKLGLTLSNVITLSGAAVSLHMGEVGHSRLVAFILYFLGINLGGWVDLDQNHRDRLWKWISFFLNNFVLFGLLTMNVFEEGIDSNFKQISWILRVVGVFFILAYCSLTVFFEFVKDKHTINEVIVKYIRYSFLEQIPLFRDLFLILGIKQNPKYGNVFMSDGGHYENLGLLKLLRDRKEKIFAFDASQDNTLCLTDLYNCLEKAIKNNIIEQDEIFFSTQKATLPQTKQNNPPNNVKYAVDRLLAIHEWTKVEFNVNEPLLRYSTSNFIVVSVKYVKNQKNGTIWYGKATLTGEENGMIKLYQRQKHVFPHHSTMLQYFKREDFLAYYELGRYVAECIVDDEQFTNHNGNTNTNGNHGNNGNDNDN